MKILIDADGCPVVSLTVSLSKKFNLEVMIFCDSSHYFASEYAQVITVMKGLDAVDFELIKFVKPGDIVVTQDYGLAAMALAKGGRVINQNGLIYTQDNIDHLLLTRHENSKIRKAGGRVKGPKKRIQKDDEQFRKSFYYLCTKEGS